MANFKKAISFDGANKKVTDFLQRQGEVAKAAAKGIAGDKLYEAVPDFLSTPAENVMTNENNSWIPQIGNACAGLIVYNSMTHEFYVHGLKRSTFEFRISTWFVLETIKTVNISAPAVNK